MILNIDELLVDARSVRPEPILDPLLAPLFDNHQEEQCEKRPIVAGVGDFTNHWHVCFCVKPTKEKNEKDLTFVLIRHQGCGVCWSGFCDNKCWEVKQDISDYQDGILCRPVELSSLNSDSWYFLIVFFILLNSFLIRDPYPWQTFIFILFSLFNLSLQISILSLIAANLVFLYFFTSLFICWWQHSSIADFLFKPFDLRFLVEHVRSLIVPGLQHENNKPDKPDHRDWIIKCTAHNESKQNVLESKGHECEHGPRWFQLPQQVWDLILHSIVQLFSLKLFSFSNLSLSLLNWGQALWTIDKNLLLVQTTYFGSAIFKGLLL